MSLITRNAKEYRSMTAQLMSQNLRIVSGPFGILCVLRHPISNHFVLAGANNRNVIITYRFLAAPVQANREFFLYWLYDCIFQLQVLTRELLECLLVISPSGRNPCGDNKKSKTSFNLILFSLMTWTQVMNSQTWKYNRSDYSRAMYKCSSFQNLHFNCDNVKVDLGSCLEVIIVPLAADWCESICLQSHQ